MNQRLVDVLPEYSEELADRLHDAGWTHLADSIEDVRFSRVHVADDRCAFLTGLHESERIGAIRVELAEESVEIKFDRIVYVDIHGAVPARQAVRGLTSAAAAG